MEDLSSSASLGVSSLEDTGTSDVVDWKPPECRFLVKGGNANDEGVTFTMPFENRFHMVYVRYARRVGVRPNELRLFHRKKYISPEDCPFLRGFKNDEVVLAYAKDCKTPVFIKPAEDDNMSINFTVQDLKTCPTKHSFSAKKRVMVRDVKLQWSRKHNVTGDRVTLYLDGENITWKNTLEEAGVYDGAVVYGIIHG